MATWQHELIPVKTLPSGAVLNLDRYTFTSPQPGPTVYLQASVHGAEIQGQGVLYYLMQYLLQHEFAGKITLIAQANPMAVNHKQLTHTCGRYNPLTGQNWNRSYFDLAQDLKFDFASFAQKYLKASPAEIAAAFKAAWAQSLQDFKTALAYGMSDDRALCLTLQRQACAADYVIDLHAAINGTYYLYAAEDDPLAPAWHLPFIIRIPYIFAGALDEASFMPWHHLKTAFKNLGREITFNFASYTVELGSEECFSAAQSKHDLNYLLSFLQKVGVLSAKTSWGPGKIYQSKLANFKTYYAPTSGLVDFLAQPGTLVKQGTPLAQFLCWPQLTKESSFTQALPQLVALKDAAILNHSNSNLAVQGQELIQVLEEVGEV